MNNRQLNADSRQPTAESSIPSHDKLFTATDSRTTTADSRQPNSQSLLRTVYLIDGDIYNELPTAESSIQPNADSQILNHFSEQIIDGDIFYELPTAERRQPTAESSIPSPAMKE